MSERSYHGATSRSPGRKKEGNVLFNDALNTIYLRLYGVGHMVEDALLGSAKPVVTVLVMCTYFNMVTRTFV